MTGRIFDVKRFAIHDGGGIRTTAFMKGCPLSCAWCHNPEGMRPEPEMLVRHERCIRCGTCAAACPSGAVRLGDAGVWIDRAACDLSLACERACPTGAIGRAYRDVTDDELVEELMRDHVFFERGGGVTLSGGEPLSQPAFALSVLEKLRARGVHTCVETSMYASESVIRAIARAADHLIVDIKLMDEALHKKWTGASNAQILKNFGYLARSGTDVLVRVPLIPGITATDENVRAIARFVYAQNPAIEVELLNYNPLAPGKYAMMARPYFDERLRALGADEFARLKGLAQGAKEGAI